ncbi:GDP-mannose 4,6-dehydratase [Novosphingobium sp. MW5]|nr:GDP-mannose 4,6-dehydratase [Novosphingobium sp. MW5]
MTRKITRGLANIAQAFENCLYMGNIDSLRDWGHAKDYVRNATDDASPGRTRRTTSSTKDVQYLGA